MTKIEGLIIASIGKDAEPWQLSYTTSRSVTATINLETVFIH